MTGQYDFTINQGADFERPIQWKNADGTYVSFTGYTVNMVIRYGYKSGELALELTTENGRIIISGNTLTIVLTDTETSALEVKPCVYDLSITKDSDTIRLLEGNITISPEVKRGD